MAGRYDTGPTGDMCLPGTATADRTGYPSLTYPEVDTHDFSQLDPPEEIPYIVFRMN